MNGYLIALALYSVLLVAVGLVVSRLVRKGSDFFVAGRSLGPGLIFSTFLAANIGAGSTVGATGLAYHIGASAWWWVGSAGIGCFILATTVGPRIWTLAKEHNFYTVGDFLEKRYGQAVRGVVALLLWFGTLAILAGQLIAISWILNAVAGVSKPIGCLLGGAITVIYFSAGGLRSAVWVNVVQLCVKMSGFMVAAPVALATVGGFDAIRDELASNAAHGYFNYGGIGLAGVMGYLLLLAPSFIVSPGLLQKLYGAKDKSAVMWGIGLNALAMVGFAFLPVILGMVAATRFSGLDNAELALPMVMTQVLPFWLGTWALAAIFSAELSAADAVLFMLSTSLAKDLYQSFLRPGAGDQELLRVGRFAAVAAGTTGVLLAIGLPSIISALSIFYGLVSVALFVPLITGLYSVRPGSGTALAAILISVCATLFVQLYTTGKGIMGIAPIVIGMVISAAVMALGAGWEAVRSKVPEH
ncbi:MAG: sodium:solute symporter family protein [Acidobacteria bacterium]|nr:sodium:solute symporter family protein [Acidobacteriota bacterium]